MKERVTAVILILLFVAFSVFYCVINRRYTVMSVISSSKIAVTSRSKTENICIDADAFSLNSEDDFIDYASKTLKLPHSELVALGYLADDFAQKTLINKKVSVKYLSKQTAECKYAKVKLNGMDYADILRHHGFAMHENILTDKAFKLNLDKARKLDLVILNHHSNKYHTLDCPYGAVAHDAVIITAKQLPKSAVPCKFCHNILKNQHDNVIKINNIIRPRLVISDGFIDFINTDATVKQKPDKSCNAKVCKSLVSLINSASSSIDIAAYGYDDIPAITNALFNAKARGIKIRYVYDEAFDSNKNHYKSNNVITNLAISARSDKTSFVSASNMLMHNKFVIFDNSVVYTGSANLSMSAMSDYDVNSVVIIKSPDVAGLYSKEFEQMLNGRFHNNKQKIIDNNIFKVGNSIIEVYFSPKDTPVKRIIELVNSSENYIYVPTFLITHKELAAALINARKRGVDVRIIADANSPYTTHSKNNLLRTNSILLKTENFGGKLHSKSMIIDDKYVITGSMNFSNSGNIKNDENVLVIENGDIAKSYKQFFLYLWTKIPDKYLKHNAKPESPESAGSCADGVDNNFNGKTDYEDEFCRKS